ncbi:hypothetical protein SNEBB_005052 [Seison nebaliae]|nr:hypothetical protein SNEBB_005052 [Seison nebaliae]
MNKTIEKIHDRAENRLAKGDFYQAHQMYKSMYFRFMNHSNEADAISIAHNGCLQFLEHNQIESAFDMAKSYMNALNKFSTKYSEEREMEIMEMMKKMKKVTMEDREELLTQFLQWSSSNEKKKGHPHLLKGFGEIMMEEEHWHQARIFLKAGEEAEVFTRLLILMQQVEDKDCEIQLFLTQAILQQLSMNRLEFAKQVYEYYAINHPKLKMTVNDNGKSKYPLINFCWFLVGTIINKNKNAYQFICWRYKNLLKVDSEYFGYLKMIDRIYFNIVTNTQSSNPVDMIMRMMMGGPPQSNTSNTTTTQSAPTNPLANLFSSIGNDLFNMPSGSPQSCSQFPTRQQQQQQQQTRLTGTTTLSGKKDERNVEDAEMDDEQPMKRSKHNSHAQRMSKLKSLFNLPSKKKTNKNNNNNENDTDEEFFDAEDISRVGKMKDLDVDLDLD